jgi:hypothetical protein
MQEPAAEPAQEIQGSTLRLADFADVLSARGPDGQQSTTVHRLRHDADLHVGPSMSTPFSTYQWLHISTASFA